MSYFCKATKITNKYVLSTAFFTKKVGAGFETCPYLLPAFDREFVEMHLDASLQKTARLRAT